MKVSLSCFYLLLSCRLCVLSYGLIVVFLQEMPKSLSENDDRLLTLVKMGFNEEEALVALERLGALHIIDRCIFSRPLDF